MVSKISGIWAAAGLLAGTQTLFACAYDQSKCRMILAELPAAGALDNLALKSSVSALLGTLRATLSLLSPIPTPLTDLEITASNFLPNLNTLLIQVCQRNSTGGNLPLPSLPSLPGNPPLLGNPSLGNGLLGGSASDEVRPVEKNVEGDAEKVLEGEQTAWPGGTSSPNINILNFLLQTILPLVQTGQIDSNKNQLI